MAGAWLSQLVRQLRRGPPADGGSDADLLARFARDRDGAAFELLVWRHGGMVLSACRRALGHHHDAEDAFQATFLVLARSAGGIGRGAALPAWLHRVAVRICARAARRRQAASPLDRDVPAADRPDPAAASELAALLDAEIDRLPDRLRRAVVLCYLDGLTAAEAGRRLGCPTGTVESRLAAARRTLRVRLARRGVTTPVGVFALIGGEAVLAPEAVAALARAGAAFGRGESTVNLVGESPIRLAKGALTMSGKRVWAAAGAVGLAVAVSAGVGYGWADTPAASPDEPAAKADPAVPPKDKPAGAKPAEPAKPEAWPLARRWALNGRLLGVTPDGRSLVMRHPQEVVGFDLTTGTGSRFAVRSPNTISDAAVSPDGKWIATAEGTNGVKVRALPSGEVVEALWPSGRLPVTRVAFAPDGSRLVTLGDRVDVPAVREGFPPGAPIPAGISGQPPAPATLHYQLSVWDPATWKEVGHPAVTVTGSDRAGYRIALTGGRYALLWVPQVKEDERGGAPYSAPNGTLLTVLDTVSGAGDKRFTVREGVTPAVAGVGVDGGVSPDGRSVLAVDVAKPAELIVLDAVKGTERLRLGGLRRPIAAAAYSPDGRWIAAATGLTRPAPKATWGGPSPVEEEAVGPSAVVVWDAATGREAARMTDKETIRNYTALRFAPDGSFLVGQDAAGTISIWGHPPAPEPVTPPPSAGRTKSPAGGEVPDRFAALVKELSADGVTDARRIEAVFLAALGRLPTETEAATVAGPFGRRTDKPAALHDLLFILTNTAEFKAHAAALGKLAK